MMRITKIEVANVAGLARADINLQTGALLVAGANMSGKSSLRDAISMALTGQPSRVSKKKDLDQMVHDGAKKGRATIYSGEEVLGQFTLPKGEFSGPEIKNAEYLPLVIDPAKFAAMSSDERRTTLFKITGCSAGMKAIEPLLAKRSLVMPLFEEVKPMLRSGFPAAEKFAQDKAREAKGAWKATTGETWGSDKADGWEMELPAVALPTADEIEQARAAVAKTEQDIANGNQHKGALQEQKRQHEGSAQRIDELREKAEGLDRAKAKLANTEKDLAEWSASAQDLTSKLNSARAAAAGCECPSCGAMLKIEGAILVPYQPENAKAGNVAELQVELKKATDARDMLERTQRNDLAAIAAAEQAKADLATAEQAGTFDPAALEKTIDALNMLQQRLAGEKAKAESLADLRAQADSAAGITKKAAELHTEVAAWLEIADAMSPEGIPAELLQQALAPINQSLQVLAGIAGWPLVEISRDIEVTSQGRPYPLISESEKWRADTLLALAIAQITELRLVLLDRFDVLEPKARGQLIGLVHQLISMETIDTVIMLGTLKEKPSALPEGFTAAWISNCIMEV